MILIIILVIILLFIVIAGIINGFYKFFKYPRPPEYWSISEIQNYYHLPLADAVTLLNAEIDEDATTAEVIESNTDEIKNNILEQIITLNKLLDTINSELKTVTDNKQYQKLLNDKIKVLDKITRLTEKQNKLY